MNKYRRIIQKYNPRLTCSKMMGPRRQRCSNTAPAVQEPHGVRVRVSWTREGPSGPPPPPPCTGPMVTRASELSCRLSLETKYSLHLGFGFSPCRHFKEPMNKPLPPTQTWNRSAERGSNQAGITDKSWEATLTVKPQYRAAGLRVTAASPLPIPQQREGEEQGTPCRPPGGGEGKVKLRTPSLPPSILPFQGRATESLPLQSRGGAREMLRARPHACTGPWAHKKPGHSRNP